MKTISELECCLDQLKSTVNGVTVAGDKTFTGDVTFEGTATFDSSVTFENINVTGDTSGVSAEFTGDVTATNYKVGVNQVVGARGAAIADLAVTATSGSLPTATSAVTIANTATPTVVELLKYCVELETKLEALLARLRTHGLIAP